MRLPFWFVLEMVVLGLGACGAAADSFPPGAAPTATGVPDHAEVQPPRLDAYLPAHAQFLRADTRPPGRALADVLPRLYFVATSRQPALPDVAKLRAIGTEAVDLEGALIIDDSVSPFGQGAAAHFELTLPLSRHIEPGQEIEVEVRFLADTTELQNAVLEIYTTADNTPLVRVNLTGKFFQTP